VPPKRSTPKTLHRAWELRKEPTTVETKLWACLRLLQEDGVHFRRQHSIGPYITDFCAPRRKLIIEVDGSQHLEQEEYDVERTSYLESKGYCVLRFWNGDVLKDISSVMCVILEELEKSEPQGSKTDLCENVEDNAAGEGNDPARDRVNGSGD
jgi:very-short-patch-repair endonuclease